MATATLAKQTTRQGSLWGDAEGDLDDYDSLPAPSTFPVAAWDALCDKLERLESHYPGRTLDAEDVPRAWEVDARRNCERRVKEREERGRLRDGADHTGGAIPRRGRAWDVAMTGIPDTARMDTRRASVAIRREFKGVMERARLARERRARRLREKVERWLVEAGIAVPEEARDA